VDHLILRSLSPKNLKSEARSCFPRVQSSYLTEAIAKGLGFRTQAALLSSERDGRHHQLTQPFELKRFGQALVDFGFDPEAEFQHKSWVWQSAMLWEVLWDFAMEREPKIELDGSFVLSVSTLEVVSSLSQIAGIVIPDDLDEPDLTSDWLSSEMSALSQAVIALEDSDTYFRRYPPVGRVSLRYDTHMLTVEFSAAIVERVAWHQKQGAS